MPIENRDGACRTCDGPVYRVPNKLPDTPDHWVHRRTADWLNNPHPVDPIAAAPQPGQEPTE